MSINGISGLPPQTIEYLAEMKKEQEQLLANSDMAGLVAMLPEDSVDISRQALTRNQNMVSGNFSGGRVRDTKYLDARAAGAEAAEALQNATDSGVGMLMDGFAEAAFWYGDPKMRQAKMMKDATESNEGVFAGIKSSIEEKAAEAMAPRDENGEPIGRATATTTASVGSAPAGTTPAPDSDPEG
jgi:hypothetical protein